MTDLIDADQMDAEIVLAANYTPGEIDAYRAVLAITSGRLVSAGAGLVAIEWNAGTPDEHFLASVADDPQFDRNPVWLVTYEHTADDGLRDWAQCDRGHHPPRIEALTAAGERARTYPTFPPARSGR